MAFELLKRLSVIHSSYKNMHIFKMLLAISFNIPEPFKVPKTTNSACLLVLWYLNF